MKRWRSYSADQWREWIAAQRRSGQTVEAFCKSVKVSTQSFYRWRTKLGDSKPVADAASPGFIPLTVVEADDIEISLPCGAIIRAPRDEAALKQVLAILMELSVPC